VVLVDVKEATRLSAAMSAAPTHPDALYVAFPSEIPPSNIICRLKSSDRTLRYLDEVENAMKARKGHAKRS
jgi:hypothetical protein